MANATETKSACEKKTTNREMSGRDKNNFYLIPIFDQHARILHGKNFAIIINKIPLRVCDENSTHVIYIYF